MKDALFTEVQRDFLLAATGPTGVKCPCCQQHLRVYKRRMNRRAVQHLISLWESGTKAGQKFHAPDNLGLGGEWARLRQWGLIREVHPGKHDGVWAITDYGAFWLAGDTSLPSVALMRLGHCVGYTGYMVKVDHFK